LAKGSSTLCRNKAINLLFVLLG